MPSGSVIKSSGSNLKLILCFLAAVMISLF
jgi:hypothetical protein